MNIELYQIGWNIIESSIDSNLKSIFKSLNKEHKYEFIRVIKNVLSVFEDEVKNEPC